MARNRQTVDREVKLAEMLDAAEALLLEGGYDRLSAAAVATEVGVARGAVHWYFPTKDDLFVAAAARMIATATSDPPEDRTPGVRIAWALDRLAELDGLTTTLRERARVSDAAADLERGVQEEVCARLRQVLDGHVSPDDLAPTADSIVTFVQGLLAMPLAHDERHRRLTFLLARLLSP